jgi:hypothetical protein
MRGSEVEWRADAPPRAAILAVHVELEGDAALVGQEPKPRRSALRNREARAKPEYLSGLAGPYGSRQLESLPGGIVEVLT